MNQVGFIFMPSCSRPLFHGRQFCTSDQASLRIGGHTVLQFENKLSVNIQAKQHTIYDGRSWLHSTGIVGCRGSPTIKAESDHKSYQIRLDSGETCAAETAQRRRSVASGQEPVPLPWRLWSRYCLSDRCALISKTSE